MSYEDRDDEYENDELDDSEFEDEEYESGILRWVSIAFVVAAIGGFAALAWYAYKSGMEPVSEDEIPMVSADTDPYKEKPEDPGGLQFDHQDKSVYNQLATGNGAERPMAERLLPPPEEPMERAQPTEPMAPEDFTKEAVDKTIVETPIPATPKSDEGKATVEVITAPEHADAEMAKPTPAIAPMKVAEPKPAPVPAPAPTPTPAVPPKAAPAASSTTQPQIGQFMAQLGAFSSQSDAKEAWDKISAEHGSMFPTKNHVLQSADVNGKTFHRLQVGPFDSEASARKVCAYLQQQNQACFVVSVK